MKALQKRTQQQLDGVKCNVKCSRTARISNIHIGNSLQTEMNYFKIYG